MEQEKPVSVQGTDRVMAETKRRDAGFVMKGHHCHYCYEFFYVRSGCCRILINEDIYQLHAGNIILIPPMALHYTRFMPEPCVRTVIMFRREDVTDDVRACMHRPEWFFTETGWFEVPEEHRPRVEDWIDRIEAENEIEDSRSDAMRKYLLQSLLLLCGRVCTQLPVHPVDLRTEDQQVLQAARYICEHYTQPVSSQDVADAVGFSPNYLSRRFRTAAGIGLHEYLVFIRLHHAAQELVSTRDSITSIALRCGFADSNYFKDSFKKKFGVTPRDYRKMI